MISFRAASLAAVTTAIVAGCSGSSVAPVSVGRAPAAPTAVVGTFTGEYDPATGLLSIRSDAPAATAPGALANVLPWSDGVPNSNPVNTVEIFTDPGFTPTTVVNGCNNGKQGNSFEGDVTIRTYFKDQPLKNVYVELTVLAPTNFTSCNSAAAAFNLNAGLGLWSYGSFDPVGAGTNSVTQRWKFRLRTSQAFTFTGRIMADVGAPVAYAGTPEFNWWATSIVTPPRTFKRAPTTLAHVAWNGASFVDELGGLAFVPSVASATFTSVAPNLASPAKPYATGFTSTAYFVADSAQGADALDTSGDFTACVKFKPGANPGQTNPVNKVLLAKGDARSGAVGWALMQMHNEYCFHYRTPADNAQGLGDVMSYVGPGSERPELYAFDYVCGGRNGDVIYAGAHGHDLGIVTAESGSFPSGGAGLPFSIGAYPDGGEATPDAGVYELIIDSRPMSASVMREIVGVAEGRTLSGMVGGVATLDALNATSMATYDPTNATSTFVVGADDAPTLYDLPPFATVPAASDGSGLLAPGTIVQYWHPLFEDTRATGFCAGAEVVSTGAWTGVAGTLLGFEDTGTRILLNPFFLVGGMGFVRHDFGATEAAWPAGSAHLFKACVAPSGAGNYVRLYVDGTLVAAGTPTGLADLSNPLERIGMGGSVAEMFDPDGPLSGARIRRVFMCPTPDPAGCN